MNKNLDNVYRYEFWVGTKSFVRYGLDDRSSRRVLARYLQMWWKKCNQEYYNEFPITVTLKRDYCKAARIVPATPSVQIENFDGNEIGIQEFCRVWG